MSHSRSFIATLFLMSGTLMSGLSCARVEPPATRAPAVAAGAPAPSTHASSPAPPSVEERLARLDLLFETRPLEPLPAATEPSERVRQFVRSRMKQDSFYDAVIPRLFSPLYAAVAIRLHMYTPFVVLKSGQTARGERFYYLDTPCKPADLQEVAPWWDLRTKVRVCRDSYRPNVDSYEGPRFCESSVVVTRERALRQCGCRQHLVNCAKDWDDVHRADKGLFEEPIRTMQYVITNHLPFSQALAMRDTVRDDYADFFYARNRYYQTGRFELASLDPAKPATLRPRPNEFAGGVLTTWFYNWINNGPRPYVASVWETFLGTPFISSDVHANMMFNLQEGGTLRTHDHMELTHQTGCKDCHVRLEYGMRAFRQFTPISIGYRSLPIMDPDLTTRFYVSGPTDLHGEGPATPLWIGEQIGKQPEFVASLVRRVEDLLYGGFPVPPRVHERLLADFGRDQDLARLLENATVAWVLGST
jgi:hypothetical protein